MMKENENIWIESSLYSPLMVKDAVDMALDVLARQGRRAGQDYLDVQLLTETTLTSTSTRRTPFTNLKVLQRGCCASSSLFC